MYNSSTLEQYLKDFFDTDLVFKSDKGFYVRGVNSISRKDISEVEKKTDLFLNNIAMHPLSNDLDAIELEFIKI